MQTPYFVIRKDEINNNFAKLTNALNNYWNNYIIGYSYKTNSLPWIAKYFDSKQCYAEVVSEDEYNLAKFLGVNKDRIIYNGPIKTKESFFESLVNGDIVNIDSHRELEWLKELNYGDYKIGLRINFDIEKYCPNQSQCPDEGGRFGFCYENGEFARALNVLKSLNYDIQCLHLHVSSKTRSLDIYSAIAMMACKIKKEYNLNLKYVDIGGGFFGGLLNKPQFDDYFKLISGILKTEFNPRETTIVVEPGMALIGAGIDYVCKVIDVKDTSYNRFIVTDGSRINIDPLMTKKTYYYDIDSQSTNIIPSQIITGFTCMEHDRLFKLLNEKELNIDDTIIFHKVGAYTICLSPLFIKYFPDVYVQNGNEFEIVREKWTVNEYVQKCRS